jgi:hypothetical protein
MFDFGDLVSIDFHDTAEMGRIGVITERWFSISEVMLLDNERNQRMRVLNSEVKHVIIKRFDVLTRDA